MKKKGFFRLGAVLLFFITIYLLLAASLFYWQIIRSKDLKKIGEDQSSNSLIEHPARGKILFSDNFPIAANITSFLVYSNPKLVDDKNKYSDKLSEILSLDKASISAQLSKNLFWVKIANNVSLDKKIELEKLKIPGVGFSPQSVRFYPEASIAAHLVGFVGKDKSGLDKGYFGIEGFYNDLLSGTPGRLFAVHDALGNTILNDIREEKRIDGKTLVLTIDRTIQFIAQKKLKNALEKYGAEGGSVIVMDSATGKILAMASFPSFDNKKYYEFDSGNYKNPVISDLYEPGSTFKILVMASALDKGVVTPETKCNICAKPIQIGEYSIKTWNDKYFPNTTMTDVIKHSDNTGMVFVGRRLGLSNLLNYLSRFGIGEKTDIDLQGEASSEIRDEKYWYSIDLATATFGQGISVTPLQLITAVNSIANNGELVKPYVVSKIISENGKEVEIKPSGKKRVISESAARIMNLMMLNAVENGEAKFAKIKGYKISGKTGTAQIPVAGHYDPHQTIASFIGFFPSEKPRITMFVIVKRPKSSIYGAETAAPIFFSLTRDILNYYNIPPSN